jgi:hypothetical protein
MTMSLPGEMLMRFRILAILLLICAVPLLASADEPEPNPPVLPTAKMVALSGKMKVSEALAALTKQTGIVVEDRRGVPDAVLDFDSNKDTFWRVLDQIAAVADAQVDLYSPDGKLALKKRIGKAPLKGPQTVSYDGLFRTSIKGITASIDPETGESTYKASLEVAWEPTLQPFYLETRPQNLVVKFAQGKQLPPVDLGMSVAPVDGRNAFAFETPFPALPREARKIDSVEGKLTILAPSRMLTIAFTDPLDRLEKAAEPPTVKTPEGVVCKLSKIKLAKDRWEIKVTLDYPPGNTELGSYQSWVVNNELVLEANDGKTRFPATTYVLDSATSQHAVITYIFKDDAKQIRGKPADWKLTYRTPASVVTIPIAFAFKNVPLP